MLLSTDLVILFATTLAVVNAQAVHTYHSLSCSTAFGATRIKPIPHTTYQVTSTLLDTAFPTTTIFETLPPPVYTTTVTIVSTYTRETTASLSLCALPTESSDSSIPVIAQHDKRLAKKSYATQVVCTNAVLILAQAPDAGFITSTITAPASTETATVFSTATATASPCADYFLLQVNGGYKGGSWIVLDTYGDLNGDYYAAVVDDQSGASPFSLVNNSIVWSNQGGLPWYANQQYDLSSSDSLVLYFSNTFGGGLDEEPQPVCEFDAEGTLLCMNSFGRNILEVCPTQRDFDDDDGPFLELSASVGKGCDAVSLVAVPIDNPRTA